MLYIGTYLQDPDNYRNFLRCALKYADRIGVYYTSDFSAFKGSRWYELLGESVIGHEYSERGVLCLFLKIDHVTVGWLKGKKGIFDFMQTDDGDYLWDICFFKDGSEVFSSTTHEELAYISEEMWQEYNSKAAH